MKKEENVKRLPFTMRTVFQDLLLLTFAVPPSGLAAELPSYVHPYVKNGQSFISIVVGNIRGMRPEIVPEFLGVNYYQIVYRAVVSLWDKEGKEYPGVFFLRSDSNDATMSFFGNQLTEFKFHYFQTGSIGWYQKEQDMLLSVETNDRGGDLVAQMKNLGDASSFSCAVGFKDLDEEKKHLVELFHAYAYDPEKKLIYDLEIERGEWHLQRLEMQDIFSAFFFETPFFDEDVKLVSSLYIQECNYIWKPMVGIFVEELQERDVDSYNQSLHLEKNKIKKN